MKKNVVLAIVFSTIVVIGSLYVQSLFFSKNSDSKKMDSKIEIELNEETEVKETDKLNVAEEKSESSESIIDDFKINVEDLKIFKIDTGVAEIILTNQGGDLVSYKLNGKKDNYTGEGVQLADFSANEENTITVDGVKYSKNNRACGITFNVSDDEIFYKPVENFIFAVEKDDDKVYEKFLNGESKYSVSFKTKLKKGNKEFYFIKKYTFNKNEYMFKLDLDFIPVSKAEGKLYYSIKTAPRIGPKFESKNKNDKREFIGYDGKDDESKNLSSWNEGYYHISSDTNSKWTSIASKYFISFVIPYEKTSKEIDNSWWTTRNNDGDELNAQSILRRGGLDFSNGEKYSDTYYFYMGPRTESELKKYKYQKKNEWGVHDLDLTEAAPSSWLGWLETILKWILQIIQKVVKNWGVSIIVMTLLIKLLMFPFTRKQSLSTIKMKELQPKIQEIQLKYKDNPQKMQQQMANLYKSSGYNPLSGCLPLIVQFFILFAMYNLFNNYYEFYGSEFIPGWITDLSSGDSVYHLGFNIPFLGDNIRLLPIIYLASQLLYGKITGTGSSGGVSNVQMKIMMYGMPIIFFFVFYNFPSGLILYWTVSNIFQMIQQIIINQMVKKTENSRK